MIILDDNSPDPEKYIKTLNGFAMKPKQCDLCRCLFVPGCEEMTVCNKCEVDKRAFKRKITNLRNSIYKAQRLNDKALLEKLKDRYVKITGKAMKTYNKITFRKKEIVNVN